MSALIIIVGAGDSEGTRTLDLLRDRQAFYSSELRSQIKPMSFALLYPYQAVGYY